jgi:Glyoxalase-like domain
LEPVHLDFIVTDLDEVVGRLCGLGATLDREIQIREYGRMANMADPFGNGFDLIEFSGSGTTTLSVEVLHVHRCPVRCVVLVTFWLWRHRETECASTPNDLGDESGVSSTLYRARSALESMTARFPRPLHPVQTVCPQQCACIVS